MEDISSIDKEKKFNLLKNEIKEIIDNYETRAKETGENFNIFKILKLERNEIRHSALLAELFNSEGTHGFEDTFLQLFVQQQIDKSGNEPTEFIKKLKQIKINNDYVAKTEHHIGYKNETGTEGGRIDVIISNKIRPQNAFIIENKIDAGDQNNQLVRYYEYNSNAPIFYLTLFGYPPSDYSKGDLIENKDFICISYEKDILSWLRCCLGKFEIKSIQDQFVFSSIKQYIYLIEHLTNQNLNIKMEKEIISTIVDDPVYIEVAYIIYSNWRQIEKEIIDKTMNSLKNLKIADVGKYEQDERGVLANIFGWENYCIRPFFASGYDILQLRIESKLTDSSKQEIEEEIIKKLEEDIHLKGRTNYIAKSLEDKKNCLWATVIKVWGQKSWKEVLNDNKINEEIKNEIETVIKEISQCLNDMKGKGL